MAAGNNDRDAPRTDGGSPAPAASSSPHPPEPAERRSSARAKPTLDHARVIEALPKALRVARMFARLSGARSREDVEDCEQAAAQKLLEVLPRHDPARGPLATFAWKHVAGTVTRLRRRGREPARSGEDDALDATEELRARTDPLDDDDEDAKNELLGHCRHITARRCLGYTRAPLPARPDDILMRVEAFEALAIAFSGLDHAEKRFLVLRYWENLTWEHVAGAMGITVPQAKGIEQRLRHRLRRDLVRKGVDRPPPSDRT